MARTSFSRSLLSAALAAVTALTPLAAAPARADHLDGWQQDGWNNPAWDEDGWNEAGWNGEASHRRVYRDEYGRFVIRRGEKHYIQFWNKRRPPVRYDDSHWGDKVRHPVRPREETRRDKTAEAAIIAGIAGLVVGGIIAGSQQQPQRVIAQPRPVAPKLPHDAFPERPRDVGSPRVVTLDGAFEPWSQGWADWCRARYRSFDIRTGTFTGYDGVKRFCEVK